MEKNQKLKPNGIRDFPEPFDRQNLTCRKQLFSHFNIPFKFPVIFSADKNQLP